MDKKTQEELKEKLEKEKALIEKQLSGFAKKDPKLVDDWDTRYPQFHGNQLEDEADEVEEYSNRLPVEHSLEVKLRDINIALKKIEKDGKYGICEKCKNPIDIERLRAYPEARLCTKCKR